MSNESASGAGGGTSHRTRVLFVDDSTDIRDLYCRVINHTDDLACVGTRESTLDLERVVEETRADIAIIDLIGPDRDAMEAIRSTTRAHPACRIIAFSGMDDAQTHDQALDAGAWSLISKSEDVNRLLQEIRRVASL